MVVSSGLKILDPVQETSAIPIGLAPRLDTLNGKTIGIFNNGKLNSAKLLECVADELHERYELKGIVRGPTPKEKLKLKPDSQLESGFQFGLTLEGVENLDAIVLANGD